MIKRKILIAAAILLSAGWGVRFSMVNKDVDIPVVQIYERGAAAPIETDFFDYGDERMDGYSVTVLDAELLSNTYPRKHFCSATTPLNRPKSLEPLPTRSMSSASWSPTTTIFIPVKKAST